MLNVTSFVCVCTAARYGLWQHNGKESCCCYSIELCPQSCCSVHTASRGARAFTAARDVSIGQRSDDTAHVATRVGAMSDWEEDCSPPPAASIPLETASANSGEINETVLAGTACICTL